MFKWIIVGGGIQGITMASYLIKQKKLAVEDLIIIDQHAEPLANWRRCTNVISMPYLRSPAVHHLDVNPFSLDAFGKKNVASEAASFYGRYKRPSLLLFENHCDHLINDLELEQAWVQGAVEAVSKITAGWQVHLQNAEKIQGENLVLAIGNSEQLSWPEWAVALKDQFQAPVHHIFDPALPDFGEMKAPFTVIGGGITAVHLAMKLSALFPEQVTLLKRHPFRIHDFDSDPGWLGPKEQIPFRKAGSYQKRRKLIAQARHKGSIPRDLYTKLLHQKRKNKLRVEEMQIHHARFEKDAIQLYDETGRMIHRSGTVLLATGFESMMPGGNWLPSVIKENGLQCANCGFPIVNGNLQWGQNLYVMGSLAELEIGPIAKNISGARQAAERIIQA
ncbi:FAD/NAD(P)-binding protein [Planococcus sp. X10-3]|uniref:FAD/NAD(P)-binding protein n=1 Tax=Planococcus sp. X10-3 TaxID=3061240 RepID=UPI003BAED097